MTDKYFALLPDAECVEQCANLERRYRQACDQIGLRNTWRLTYSAAYAKDPNFVSASAGVQAEGDVDGATSLRFRTGLVKPLVRQSIILALGDRIGYQPVPTNLDVQAQATIPLVGKLIDYCVHEARIDEVVFDAAESNAYFGSGFVHVSWDREKGEPVNATEQAKDPETGEPLTVLDEAGQPQPYLKEVKRPSGAVKLTRCFPWGVVRDVMLEESPYVIVYEPVSRHELAAQFPHLAQDILSAPGPNAEEMFEMLGFCTSIATDDVLILKHLYHRTCAALPRGRWLGYLDGLPLWSRSCPLQNGQLPIVDITSQKYFGTSLGHPEAADLIAQQEVHDDLLSAAVTNLVRFKDQTLYYDERIRFDSEKQAYALPEGVNPPRTASYQEFPAGAKAMIELLPQLMKQNAGLNSAAMGEPEGANLSGVALATLTNAAIKLQRALQLSIDSAYVSLGNTVLELIKANASNGLVAEIAGHTDAPLLHFFSQQDLSGVRRVKMQRRSPILDTFAGKLELYKTVEGKPVDEKRKIVELFTTNNVEALFGDDMSQTDLLRWENERLTAGEATTVNIYDDHKIHFPCHRAQLDKIRMMPDSREKDAAINAFGAHMQEHVNAALSLDATAAELLGQRLPQARQQAQAQAQAAQQMPAAGPQA